MDKGSIFRFMVLQKFRWDMSVTFLVFINFVLLSISASTNVQLFLRAWGIDVNIYYVTAEIIVFSFLATWFFGLVLDKMHYTQRMYDVQNDRNPQLKTILQINQRLEREIVELKRELVKRK